VPDPRYLELGALRSLSALDLVEYQVQTPWHKHVCETYTILGSAYCQAQAPQAPWTWPNTKSKRLGSNIYVRPIYFKEVDKN